MKHNRVTPEEVESQHMLPASYRTIKTAVSDNKSVPIFRVCAECGPGNPYFEEIQVLNSGDESWTVCPSCRNVEGGTVYVDENGNEVKV